MTDPNACPIRGNALISDRDGRLQWDQADHAIHITEELLDELDEAGREFVTAMYEIGEQCPYQPGNRHARRHVTVGDPAGEKGSDDAD